MLYSQVIVFKNLTCKLVDMVNLTSKPYLTLSIVTKVIYIKFKIYIEFCDLLDHKNIDKYMERLGGACATPWSTTGEAPR